MIGRRVFAGFKSRRQGHRDREIMVTGYQQQPPARPREAEVTQELLDPSSGQIVFVRVSRVRDVSGDRDDVRRAFGMLKKGLAQAVLGVRGPEVEVGQMQDPQWIATS